MSFAQDFAAASRARMMMKVKEVLLDFFPRVDFSEEVNIHHNFAAIERHFGRELVLHR